MMPVMDGITALKEIRKSGDKTYVLMLTAKAEVDDRVTGLDSGADDYIINRNFLGGRYNPEAVYQYRYFAVSVDPSHRVNVINDTNVYKLKNTEIGSLTHQALDNHNKTGTVKAGQNEYVYRVFRSNTGQKMVVFLNKTLIYNRFWLLFRVSIASGIGALIIFAMVLILVSGKAIKPIVDTYHKQQKFITNAGHELKTPLAVISANTEMEEMLGNNSEWNESTKEQVAKLINRLIALARASETGEITLSKVNFSQIVQNSTKYFRSVMKKNNLIYQVSIREGINVIAEKYSLTEIVNILLDNVRKYCDPHGKVQVRLTRGTLNKSAILRVSNTYKEERNKDYSHFFDRFYREDESHNSKKGGFGIGLAMARELTEAFRDKISVSHNGDEIIFRVSLKIAK